MNGEGKGCDQALDTLKVFLQHKINTTQEALPERQHYMRVHEEVMKHIAQRSFDEMQRIDNVINNVGLVEDKIRAIANQKISIQNRIVGAKRYGASEFQNFYERYSPE